MSLNTPIDVSWRILSSFQSYLRTNSFACGGLYPKTPFCEWYSLGQTCTEEVPEVGEAPAGLAGARVLVPGSLLRTARGTLRRLSSRFISSLQRVALCATAPKGRDMGGEARKRAAEVRAATSASACCLASSDVIASQLIGARSSTSPSPAKRTTIS